MAVPTSRLWKISSKGALLTLVTNYFAYSTFFTILWLVFEINYKYRSTTALVLGPIGVALLAMAISSPISGWMADVYLNRFTVLRSGLWLMWSGVLCATVFLLLMYKFEDCKHCRVIITATIGLTAVILVTLGFSAYAVNAVQFGIDQMPDASAEELSAYIHWFCWTLGAGNLTGRLTCLIKYCNPSAKDIYIIYAIQLMVPMTLVSLALCCNFLLRGWLIIEPGCPNSLRTIYSVLRFSAIHKHPIRRRAITYTMDEKPSRIDFAKENYGGPFTTEQVEDVKTFSRIMLVLVSTAVPFFCIIILTDSTGFLEYVSTGQQQCSPVAQSVLYSISVFMLLIIPLYTFILYPCLKKRLFKMLQRVVCAAALTFAMSGAVLIIDTIEHALDSDIACMFSESSMILKARLWWIIPLNMAQTIELMIFVIALLEFTCAQSPYSMRGLLMGIQFFILACTFLAAYGILIAWNSFQKNILPSCDFYYFLFQFLCSLGGFTVACVVAMWYKERKREDEDDQRRIVEGIYDRLLRSRN